MYSEHHHLLSIELRALRAERTLLTLRMEEQQRIFEGLKRSFELLSRETLLGEALMDSALSVEALVGEAISNEALPNEAFPSGVRSGVGKNEQRQVSGDQKEETETPLKPAFAGMRPTSAEACRTCGRLRAEMAALRAEMTAERQIAVGMQTGVDEMHQVDGGA